MEGPRTRATSSATVVATAAKQVAPLRATDLCEVAALVLPLARIPRLAPISCGCIGARNSGESIGEEYLLSWFQFSHHGHLWH